MIENPVIKYQQALEELRSDDLINLAVLLSDKEHKQARDVIDRTCELFLSVCLKEIDTIPLQRLKQMSGYCQDFLGLANRVSAADPKSGDTREAVLQLINAITAHYDNDWWVNAALIVGYLEAKGPRLQVLETRLQAADLLRRDVDKANAEFKQAATATKSEMEAQLAEVTKILNIARLASGETGVALHSGVFGKEANGHRWIAIGWLVASAAMAVVLTVAGIKFLPINLEALKDLPKGIPSGAILTSLLAPRALIATIGIYLLTFCAKNFRLSWHNHLVNRHRQLALNTFETFTKAASDDSATKNAVLLEATRTIFAAANTGFVANENDGESVTKVFEKVIAQGSKT